MNKKKIWKSALVATIMLLFVACGPKGSADADETAPVIFNGQPSGSITTDKAVISVTTDEDAVCKFSLNTAGVSYGKMAEVFTITGKRRHQSEIANLKNGQSYKIYVRCMDNSNNVNQDDYLISFTAQITNSNFNYILGDKLYPISQKPKPKKAQSFKDENFGTTITRITDGEKDLPNGGIYPEYGTFRTVNRSGKLLLLIGSDGHYRIHSANEPYETITTWNPDWSSNGGLGFEQPEYRWDYSGQHPNRLYWRSHKKLLYTDAESIPNGKILKESNPINTLVHDFENDREIIEAGTKLSDEIWNRAVIANGDAGVPSADSRYWVFALYTAGGNGKTYYRIFVYDKSEDKVISAKNVEGGYVNEVYMSPDGNYVYVGFNAKSPYNDSQSLGGGWIYKRDFSNWADPKFFMCSIPPHTNWVYDAQGFVGMIYQDNQTDYLTFKRALDGKEWKLRYALEGEGADWGRGGKHFGAMPGPERKGWALVTTYTVKHNDHKGWEDDAMYLIEIDENKTYEGKKPIVWRLATLNNDSTVDYYRKHPNASMNYSGTKVWFGSDWNTPGGKMDVYRIDLPANWWNDLNARK